MLFTLFLLSGLVSGPLDIIEHRYTMDDLDGLAAKEAWAELVLRLPDIPSAHRGERYDKLVERGALGYLAVLQTEAMGSAEGVATEMMKSYPSLRRSKEFMKLRSALGLAAFESCYAGPVDDKECVGNLHAYVEADRGNVDLVLAAAKAVAAKQGPGAAVPFYQLGLTETTREAICAKGEVKKTLLAALATGKGAAVIEEHCWAWVKADVQKELERKPAEAACALVMRKGGPVGKCK